MQGTEQILIYFCGAFLKDYFESVAQKIADANFCLVTLASPWKLNSTSYRTRIIPLEQLKQQPEEFVWVTSDILKHVSSHATKICSNHHAGYGESFFIPSVNVARYANYQFCATFKPPSKLSSTVFNNMLADPKRHTLNIVPTGYPKLDLCVQACTKQTSKDTVLITLASLADIPFDAIPVLQETVTQLIKHTDCSIYIRPKPRDSHLSVFKNLIEQLQFKQRVFLNTESYIPILARAKHTIFFGRHDVTTAYTCAYASSKAVIFVDVNADKSMVLRDIGLTINSPSVIQQALELIGSKECLKRLHSSRETDIEFLGSSFQRIVEVIKHIVYRQEHLITPMFAFEIGAKFNLDEGLFNSFNGLLEKTNKLSKNHANPYVLENYLYDYIEQSETENEFELIGNYLKNQHSRLKTINYINVWKRLLSQTNRLGISLSDTLKKQIAVTGVARFSELETPNEELIARVFSCLFESNQIEQCEPLFRRLCDTVNRKIVAILLPYAIEYHALQYRAMLAPYIEKNGFWSAKKIRKICKTTNYSLFGIGNSTQQLVDYIVIKGWPKPSFILSSETTLTDVAGIRIRDVDEIDSETAIVIVSPSGFNDIYTRLCSAGIDPKRIVDIRNNSN